MSDCFTTVTLSVAGLMTEIVPPGVVCFNCSIQGMVATNVMYTVSGNDIPMDEGMVEAGGILVVFDTDITFDPTNFMTVRCANDDGFSQTAVLVNGKQVALSFSLNLNSHKLWFSLTHSVQTTNHNRGHHYQ